MFSPESFSDEFVKIAYTAPLHREFSVKDMPGKMSKKFRALVQQGAENTDYGIRSGMLPWTDKLHAEPGSLSPEDIDKDVRSRIQSAASDVASGLMLDPGIKRTALLTKGMMDYGDALHTRMDFYTHYRKPESKGHVWRGARSAAKSLRSIVPAYGGTIVGWGEHLKAGLFSSKRSDRPVVEQAEIDNFDPRDINDQRMLKDVKRLHKKFRKELKKSLKEEHGLSGKETRRVLRALKKDEEIGAAGETIGKVLRNTSYLGKETLRAAKTFRPSTQKLLGRL